MAEKDYTLLKAVRVFKRAGSKGLGSQLVKTSQIALEDSILTLSDPIQMIYDHRDQLARQVMNAKSELFVLEEETCNVVVPR